MNLERGSTARVKRPNVRVILLHFLQIPPRDYRRHISKSLDYCGAGYGKVAPFFEQRTLRLSIKKLHPHYRRHVGNLPQRRVNLRNSLISPISIFGG